MPRVNKKIFSSRAKVIEAVKDKLPNKIISTALGITERSVRNHRKTRIAEAEAACVSCRPPLPDLPREPSECDRTYHWRQIIISRYLANAKSTEELCKGLDIPDHLKEQTAQTIIEKYERSLRGQ
jgi:hypothetical protein